MDEIKRRVMESPYLIPATVVVKVGFRKHKFLGAIYGVGSDGGCRASNCVDQQAEREGRAFRDEIAFFSKFDWVMYEQATK